MSDTCPAGCTRPRHPDYAICAVHANTLRQDLAELPALASELDITLTRLGGALTPGSRSSERGLPYGLGASEATGHIRAVLVGWVRDLDPDPARHPADTIPAMACWLLARHHRLVTHPAAEEVVREVAEVVRQGRRALDHGPERVFLGRCECGTDLTAPVGATAVRCRACGAEADVAAMRENILAALDDQLVTAAEFAQLAIYLGLIPQSGRERLRQRVNVWATRAIVTPRRRGDEPAYRYDDLAALLAANATNPRKGRHMTTHPACGKTWSGQRREHCPACCETFNSAAAGDMHRVGGHDDGTRRCLTADEMNAAGMFERAGVWYSKADSRRDRDAQSAEQAESVPMPTPDSSGPEISPREDVA